MVMAAKVRHDPCVVPRAVPIVEAMAALVLADAAMAQLARQAATDYPLSLSAFENGKRKSDADASEVADVGSEAKKAKV